MLWGGPERRAVFQGGVRVAEQAARLVLLSRTQGVSGGWHTPAMSDITDFYRRAGLTSDLGRHHELVTRLPTDAGALGAIVRGLLIHNFTAKTQGLPLSAERLAHMQTVGAEGILDNVIGLDPGPLDVERPAGRLRLVLVRADQGEPPRSAA